VVVEHILLVAQQRVAERPPPRLLVRGADNTYTDPDRLMLMNAETTVDSERARAAARRHT
jgi:hypothetical protein